jgi:FkbM family methyltransferase
MASLRAHLKYRLHNSVPGFAGRVPFHGVTLHTPPDSLALWAVCADGGFEPDIVHRLVTLTRPGTTMMDVGANAGLMAIPVLRAVRDSRVVSFEPSPTSLPWLTRTATGSEFRDRWTIVGKALADAAGELEFAMGGSRDALYEGFRSHGRIAGSRTIRVPVSTLDAEWSALGEPEVSVVKVDVEGAEGLVLEGGRRLLDAARPALLVEWHDAYLQRFGTPLNHLLLFARRHGYRIFTVPAGVPVDDEQTLMVQSLSCDNFLLVAS